MFAQLVEAVRATDVGRWIMVVGAVVAIGFFLQQKLGVDTSFYASFTKGIGAGTLAMIFLGISERFYAKKKLQQAQLPGGGGVTFEEGIDATKDALQDLNDRVTTHMSDINERMLDLEREVFKRSGSGSDGGE